MEHDNRIVLEMESRSCNESFARVVIAAFLARMDPTLEELEDVKTAVSEAVTNAIIHGYEERIGPVILEAKRSGRSVEIKVTDHGVGIEDVRQAMQPLYSGKEKGRSGMGFSFMEAFMDTLEVSSKPGEGTVVTMTKVLGGQEID